jgi:hypothetical protein
VIKACLGKLKHIVESATYRFQIDIPRQFHPRCQQRNGIGIAPDRGKPAQTRLDRGGRRATERIVDPITFWIGTKTVEILANQVWGIAEYKPIPAMNRCIGRLQLIFCDRCRTR